jgi:hypothetical protein
VASSSTLQIEALHSSNMLVNLYQKPNTSQKIVKAIGTSTPTVKISVMFINSFIYKLGELKNYQYVLADTQICTY